MLRSAERLDILRRLLASDEDLGLITSHRAVFFERDGGWHGFKSAVAASFWLRVFAHALRKPGDYHQAADTVVWGFPDLAAVVAVRLLPTALTEAPRANRVVRRLIDQTGDRFAADFDKLTNAPNRRQLERHLDRLAKTIAEFSANSGNVGKAVVMMLDLDNFKQANDTAGHDFGDSLLQATAWRLRDFVSQWMKDGVATDLCAGRWGGEEFVVAGLFPSDEAAIAASAAGLVAHFATPPMPDEQTEVPRLRLLAQSATARFPLPNPPVTASLGWSIMRPPVEEKEVPTMVQDAIARADAAMYRAKTTGKNRSVGFGEIIQRHGRILVHRTDAGIVVLDIGEFVGVREGDVFDVYAEDFADGRSYVLRDGRTQRVVGQYPTLTAAQIRVETPPQRELSFCSFVSLRVGVGQLSERAHVRLVSRNDPQDDAASGRTASHTVPPQPSEK